MPKVTWEKCHDCSLSGKLVHPRGGFKRKIMFVGEAPGADEEKEGKAFVGKSGKELDRWLAVLGLVEKDVYITNCVKCRPPDNRDPTAGELQACLAHLMCEIDALKPEFVIPLGRFARQVRDELLNVHGFEFHKSLALKHPAYYLRIGGWPSEELHYLKKQLNGERP